MNDDVIAVVERVIRTLAEERGLRIPPITGASELVDELGLSSLMVATLLAHLEETLGVDPFDDENVTVTDLRTVHDLCAVYANRLASGR